MANFKEIPRKRLDRPANTPKAYGRIGTNHIALSSLVMEALGRPERCDLLIDDLEEQFCIRPNPKGRYGFRFEQPQYHENSSTMSRFSVKRIQEYLPKGYYLPVSMGRFEGIFRRQK